MLQSQQMIDLLLHHTDDERIEVRGIWITLET